MKELIDIHTVLSTPEDLDDFHDDAEQASDSLNLLLHAVYLKTEDEIPLYRLEKMLQYTWEFWVNEPQLVDIDDDDLTDWVDQMLATWDDSDHEDD
ncbi:hypothetical protein [Alteromonas facilis]|uniref:hypothetical protein n=1 Tax=Alteromonas facilis TaxID=2048004 RepID=UPI000C29478F|nr:hypothetical protein [Alteromonas facilis]